MLTRFRHRGRDRTTSAGSSRAFGPSLPAAIEPGGHAGVDRPFVDDELGDLVDATYRRLVGRAPTRAERLLDVAELQSRPGIAGLLLALSEPDPSPLSRSGPGG